MIRGAVDRPLAQGAVHIGQGHARMSTMSVDDTLETTVVRPPVVVTAFAGERDS